MASSLLLLLDDIATILDDVATMTKVAVKKTAGVLGDDLALNAKQVTGVQPARELAVVWRVARGSAINKAILVPAALALSWLAPWAVTPLLIAGGGYLCYEGAEKILHRLLHRGTSGDGGHAHGADAAPSRSTDAADSTALESQKIAGAIRTDFILSAEIIVITLGVVAGRPFLTQLAVLLAISAAMTVGVYGLVAAIVKLDDAGRLLATRREPFLAAVGRGILAAAPWMMRGLSIAGTAAMFLVGGGIIAHGIPAIHHALHELTVWLSAGGHGPSSWAGPLATTVDTIVGVSVGLLLLGGVALVRAAPRGLRAEAWTAGERLREGVGEQECRGHRSRRHEEHSRAVAESGPPRGPRDER
jgi:predicted DNA repair protein MutK